MADNTNISTEELRFIQKLKVAELKKELKDRGLPVTGNKSELAERLTDSLKQRGEVSLRDEPVEYDDEDFGDDVLDEGDLEEDSGGMLESDLDPNMSLDIEPTSQSVAETSAASAASNIQQEEKDEKQEESKVVLNSVAKLSEAERKDQRAQKFSNSNSAVPNMTQSKKLARAERFGLPVRSDATITQTSSMTEVLKSRAERFGLAPKEISQEKKQQRAQRFGLTDTKEKITSGSILSDAILKKRKDRFGEVTTGGSNDKKRKRAERFGLA